MLKSIDVLLGLSVVMLVFSAVVTILTQAIINYKNLKGDHLQKGLCDLLAQLSPSLEGECAAHIAEKILTHPMIRQANGKSGTVIHREELTKLLLEFAAGEGPQQLAAQHLSTLQQALRANGIQNPSEILRNVQSLALQIELGNPELSNSVRHNLALLQEAGSAFLAKLNGWFDQTMDRVIDRFTLNTRKLTLGVGFVVALVVQIDTIGLINRLSVDSKTTEQLVELGKQIDANGASEAAQAQADVIQQLDALKVVEIPTSFQAWASRWTWQGSFFKIVGIVLSAILLSLGAPFWYRALSSLIRLRGLIAAKDDDQRTERQATQPSPGGAPQPAPAAAAAAAAAGGQSVFLRGERGNLG